MTNPGLLLCQGCRLLTMINTRLHLLKASRPRRELMPELLLLKLRAGWCHCWAVVRQHLLLVLLLHPRQLGLSQRDCCTCCCWQWRGLGLLLHRHLHVSSLRVTKHGLHPAHLLHCLGVLQHVHAEPVLGWQQLHWAASHPATGPLRVGPLLHCHRPCLLNWGPQQLPGIWRL